MPGAPRPRAQLGRRGTIAAARTRSVAPAAFRRRSAAPNCRARGARAAVCATTAGSRRHGAARSSPPSHPAAGTAEQPTIVIRRDEHRSRFDAEQRQQRWETPRRSNVAHRSFAPVDFRRRSAAPNRRVWPQTQLARWRRATRASGTRARGGIVAELPDGRHGLIAFVRFPVIAELEASVGGRAVPPLPFRTCSNVRSRTAHWRCTLLELNGATLAIARRVLSGNEAATPFR